MVRELESKFQIEFHISVLKKRKFSQILNKKERKENILQYIFLLLLTKEMNKKKILRGNVEAESIKF